MITRLTVAVPDRDRPAVRLLAVSDEIEPSLWEHLDRDAVGKLDLLVSCGDLPPDYLCYLEGVLRAPLLYVTGNHDLDDAWKHEARRLLPARESTPELTTAAGLDVALIDWPGQSKARTRSQERIAWANAVRVWVGAALRRRGPAIVVSHVAPHETEDPRDVYHRSFRAYGWLARQLRPPLWLHGHTTAASDPHRVTLIGPTTCVNVTGAYLIDLVPAPGGTRTAEPGSGRDR